MTLFGAQTPAGGKQSSWVETTLRSLSLEEKVGQLFVVELPAVYGHRDGDLRGDSREMIERYKVGGFLLVGGTVNDIALLTNRLQKMATVPLLINADLEAGFTWSMSWRRARGWSERLPSYASGGGTMFPSQMAIGATGNTHFAYELGRITAVEGRAAGVHWTNSPVADVNNNPRNPVINTRSFGENPAAVARMVDAEVRGLQDNGMLATLKHFPGHGDTELDTHMGLPSLPFDLERLDSVEFVPFRAGIKAGAKCIMTAHIALPRIDPTGRPATLSRPILTGLLRERLGFEGIIITDGMQMQGVTDHFEEGEAAILALEAGADIVLAPPQIKRAYAAVLEAAKSGRLTAQRIDQSVRRILEAKAWVGLDQRRDVEVEKIPDVVASLASLSLAQEMSDASVTLLRDERRELPLRTRTRAHIVIVSEDPLPGFGIDLQEALERVLGAVPLTRIHNESGMETLVRLREELQRCETAVVGIVLSVTAWRSEKRFSATVQTFLDSLSGIAPCVVIVAFGDPYVLGEIPLTRAVLTPYNGTVVAQRSVARVLLGEIDPQGRLPVSIPGRWKAGARIDRVEVPLQKQ